MIFTRQDGCDVPSTFSATHANISRTNLDRRTCSHCYSQLNEVSTNQCRRVAFNNDVYPSKDWPTLLFLDHGSSSLFRLSLLQEFTAILANIRLLYHRLSAIFGLFLTSHSYHLVISASISELHANLYIFITRRAVMRMLDKPVVIETKHLGTEYYSFIYTDHC